MSLCRGSRLALLATEVYLSLMSHGSLTERDEAGRAEEVTPVARAFGAQDKDITKLRSVRIRQYARFGIYSQSLTAAEMTARLKVEPDKLSIRGSRSADPPIPVFHVWTVICDERGVSLGAQVQRVIERLRPCQQAIAELIREPTADCEAGLSLIRHFGDEDGEEEELSSPDAPFQKLAGQHQLLGWHLGLDVLAFLVSVGASIGADEYG